MNTPNPSADRDFMSMRQVADDLGVHTVTVRRMIARGDLPAFRVGRQVRVKRSDVQALAYQRVPTGRAT